MASTTILPNDTITTLSPENLTDNATVEAEHGVCDAWLGVNDVLYQLANICLGVSFLAPNHYAYQLVFLRSIICLGSLFFMLWASLVSCLWDFLLWNLLITLVNAVHIGYMSYKMYPVSFDPCLDLWYTKLQPYHIARTEFKSVVVAGHLETLEEGDIYAKEGITRCKEKFAVLIAGRFRVTCKDVFLHYVIPHQFLDSIEFEACPVSCSDSHKYQVTFTATEKSQILVWEPGEYVDALKCHPYLAALFTHLLGKDITIKLHEMQELLFHPEADEKDGTTSVTMEEVAQSPRCSLLVPKASRRHSNRPGIGRRDLSPRRSSQWHSHPPPFVPTPSPRHQRMSVI